jgi:hypothetical protein
MPEPDETHAVSRRALLQGAASAGVAGLAVTAIGATAVGAGKSPALAAGPIVVHVRDARTGDIEVFSGTSQTRVRDRDLAARISRAIR